MTFIYIFLGVALYFLLQGTFWWMDRKTYTKGVTWLREVAVYILKTLFAVEQVVWIILAPLLNLIWKPAFPYGSIDNTICYYISVGTNIYPDIMDDVMSDIDPFDILQVRKRVNRTP